MEAPKGRYSVREQDGRLVVIDNETGTPATVPSPRQAGSPGKAPQPMSFERGKGLFEWLGERLVRLVSERIDDEGRAIIAWRWTEKGGRERRWDAVLDKAEQRRLGRALLAVAAFPTVVLLLIFTDLPALFGLFIAVPLALWGSFSISRMQRRTGN